MKTSTMMSALVASASSAVVRTDGCCFGLTAASASGSLGPVTQLLDGQTRIGDNSLLAGRFCIGGHGGITDSSGKGCILTPESSQWQCDAGAAPTPGFAVSCNGTLCHGGDNTFFACPTGQNGGSNIYSKTLTGEPGCIPVWLHADSCQSGCPPPPPPPAPPAACPKELEGNWEFPHLIIPINSADAHKAYGTQYNGTAEGSTSSIFNFDIPSSYTGKTCSLEFLFPAQDQLETSAYEFSGSGQFEFAILEGAATKDTTYATAPKVAYSFGTFTVKPGSAVDLGSCPDGCPAGKVVSFWMSPVGDSSLNYFQDSNPCPIGLYVTAS